MTSNPQFLAGERLTADKLQTLGFQDSYTPELTGSTTDPDLGTGPIQDGYIFRAGNMINLWIWIQFGSSPSVGSGDYQILLPVQYPFSALLSNGGPVGTALIGDSSGGTRRLGVALAQIPNDAIYMRTTSNDTLVTHAVPWTWAENDFISLQVSYLID